uniref:DNA repair exonuclease n=1 Tax=Marseillevirus LCMAC101 TaxID=2506602 RepID=A0A481YRT1_9VIRU|nr:MAG: DNA repair exonuclease [Marseillevirus LCMAC101]
MEDSVIKAFVIGDPHFKRNNIIDGRSFVNKCVPAADKFKPDFIVILGDTLHCHDTAYNSPFELAYELIEGLQRIAHVFIIIGNHDLINHQQFLTSKHFFLPYRRWDNVTVVDHPLYREIGSFTFTFCPYVPSGRFCEALDKLIEKGETWDLTDCIFAHQEFRGCSMENGKTSDIGDKWDENYPPVITGHIHKAQTIKNIYYPGSAYQHTFAEDPDKKVWGVTFVSNSDPPGFKIKKMDLKIKGKRRIFLDVKDVDQFDESLINKHQIQLRLHGTAEEFKVFDKSKICKNLKDKGVKISKDLITNGVDVGEKQISSHVFLDVFQELLLRKDIRIQEACKIVYPEIFKDYLGPVEIIFHDSMGSSDDGSQDSMELLEHETESGSDISESAEDSYDEDPSEVISAEVSKHEDSESETTDDSEVLNTSDVLDSSEICNTSDVLDSDTDVTDTLDEEEEEESDDFSEEEESEEKESEEEEEEESDEEEKESDEGDSDDYSEEEE